MRESAKFFATCLLIIALAGILTLPPTFSLLTSNVVIKNTGSISTSYVNATINSPTAIQNAVNAVSINGGTVFLPSGICYFNNETVTVPAGVSIIGAGIGETILRQLVPAPFNLMFRVVGNGAAGKLTRISGIQFDGLVTSSNDNVNGIAIRLEDVVDFRIDHCKFTDFPSSAISVNAYLTGSTRGVIDHNIIDNPYKDVYTTPQPMWAYGITVCGKANTWNTNIEAFLGKYETAPSDFPVVYIEDNNFSRCRHAIASNQGAWYVARYNTITEERPQGFGSIDVHGDAGGGAPGGRGFEVYNNIISGSAGYSYADAIWARGGGGVIYNNIMQNIEYGVGLYADSSNPTYQVNNLYIWGNTIDGTLINNYAGYTEGVNYFLASKSEYTPYPYPHPLTLQSLS